MFLLRIQVALGKKNLNPTSVGVCFVLPREQHFGMGTGSSGDFGCGFGLCKTRIRPYPLSSLFGRLVKLMEVLLFF
jgi:hypothetical protein